MLGIQVSGPYLTCCITHADSVDVDLSPYDFIFMNIFLKKIQEMPNIVLSLKITGSSLQKRNSISRNRSESD